MADPRSLKRPRGSSSSNSAGSAGKATARGPLFFDQFLAMPEEIRGRILDLAYHLPLSTPSAHSKLSTTPPIDISTTINLACTCRWLYLRTTFWFWRDIRITRPSALQSIQRAVSSHPQLGRIIKSLHVGPEDELAEVRRYPIMWRPHAGSSGGSIRISSSLRSAKEVQLLPRWCTPHSEWPVEHNDAHGTSEAISGALRAVERSLSYRLERYLSWQSAQTWDLAYQAQAALDLYLMSMRRLEDEHGPLTADTDSKSCSSSIIKDKQPLNYPALVLVGTEAQPTLTPASNFSSQLVLTRQQLLQHIARPGSATDSFDHPLLFARSGFDARAQGTRSRLARKEPELRIQREPEDAADVFTSEGVDNINEPKNRYTDSLDFLDITHVNAPTAGSILAILRSLLAMTPRLSNLSLTGFLERAFCGSRLGAQLKSLRCLTLGPPPALRSWHMPMNLGGLDNGGLNRVEKIRICGVMLRGDEAAKMEYRFYTTHWTMLERVSGRDLLSLGVLIDYLAGRKGVAADKALRELGMEELQKLKLPFSYSAAEEDPREDNREKLDRCCVGLVQVTLHHQVLDAMLARASSEAERGDWLRGRPRATQERCLLLTKLPAAANADGGSIDDESTLRQAMYNEGRSWWERFRKPEERSWDKHKP